MATSFFFFYSSLFREHTDCCNPKLWGVVSRVEAFLAPPILVHLPPCERVHTHKHSQRKENFTPKVHQHTHTLTRLREREFYYPFFFLLEGRTISQNCGQISQPFWEDPTSWKDFPGFIAPLSGLSPLFCGCVLT